MMTSTQKSSLAGLEPIGAKSHTARQVAAMLDDALMFKGFDWAHLEALSGYIQLYRALPGVELFHEGDQGDFMCIVLEGKLEIHKEDKAGIDKTVVSVQAGRGLGEMSMVDGEPRSATVIVVEPAVLAVLTQESFALITRDKPALAVKILSKIAQLLSQRLRYTSGVLVDYLGK